MKGLTLYSRQMILPHLTMSRIFWFTFYSVMWYGRSVSNISGSFAVNL